VPLFVRTVIIGSLRSSGLPKELVRGRRCILPAAVSNCATFPFNIAAFLSSVRRMMVGNTTSLDAFTMDRTMDKAEVIDD
jgi:hypothetical protein